MSQNITPIPLLSHISKIVETALDRRIRSSYKFHLSQLGFQKLEGTETAFLTSKAEMRDGKLFVVLLDFKATYNSVPRGKLIKLVQKALPKDLADMVRFVLVPGFISTAGEDDKAWYGVNRGVPQGSPLSPCLF